MNRWTIIIIISALAVLMLAVVPIARAQSGILNPTRYEQWARATVGVPGGIPSATWTQCGATIAPYGSSGSPASPATINNAIAACGTNQYVLLGAGTFWLNGGLDYSVKAAGHVAVRGAGPNSTLLKFTGGVACYSGQQDICFFGSGLNPLSAQTQPGGANAFNWTGGYSQGATSITVTGVGSAGLSNGQIIVLDQANDQTDNGGEVICDQNISLICLTEAPAYVGRTIGGIDYQQEQIVKITAGCASGCTGTGPFTLTITPGLYANNWNGTGATGGFWVNPQSTVGIENLTVDDSNHDCGGGTCGIFAFNGVDSGWIKNVRSIEGGRNHVWTQLASHLEIRDSYFFGVKGGASQSYGWEIGSTSDSLFENNILQQISSPNIGPGAASGNVFAYNFAINDYYTPGGGIYLQVPYFAHDAGNSFNLYEGNQWPSLACDDTHGNSALDTAFRNRLNGRDYNTAGGPGNQPVAFTQAFSFDSLCRGYNLIGNVLGTPGYHMFYQQHAATANYSDTASGSDCNFSIFDIGSAYGNCRGAADFPGDPQVINDPVTFSSMMRWGNYDTVNGAVRWDATESSPGAVTHIAAQSTPASHTLPASFYYSSEPSWWPATTPWPAIGPDVTGGSGPGGFSYSNPAAACYFGPMGGPTDGGGSVLAYDYTNCATGGGAPIVSLSTTTLTFGPVSPNAMTTQTVTLTNTGSGALIISSVSVTGSVLYTIQSNTCTGTIAASGNCHTTVSFAPLTAGMTTATLAYVDNASTSPQTVALNGSAVVNPGPPPAPIIQ